MVLGAATGMGPGWPPGPVESHGLEVTDRVCKGSP
jgi:hypothetical protein